MASFNSFPIPKQIVRSSSSSASRPRILVRSSMASSNSMLVFVPPHPLIKHWLSLLRCGQTPPLPFFVRIASRWSFLSSLKEDTRFHRRDHPLKACGCASATAENVYVKLKDPKNSLPCFQENIGVGVVGEQMSSSSSEKANLSRSMLQYNLLGKNLLALEQTFVALESLRMERDIMLQMRKLGAAELFNTCLSRSRASSTTSCLPDTGTPELVDTTEEQQTFVPSTRKLRKKARRSSLMTGNDDQGSRTTWEGIDVPRVRKPSKYRKKRERISRNEAEMSQGVKIVADMERIRTKLEEESGKVASMSCWAEAAGMNEKLLMRNLHFGWYCRDELVKCTRSLVLFLARNYRGLGIAHEDLIQAGYVGVLQGAERFDHTRGYKFSTYVQYWIRKSMSMMVSRHARGVHIPASIIRTMSQIQKARKTLKTSQGIKYPADEEISKLTGYSLKKIRAANQCLKVVGSIDKKVGDCFTTKFLSECLFAVCMQEFTPDTTMESPEEAVMRQSARREVHNLIEGLEAREKQVMVLRYGLQDYRPKSLEEIGKLLRLNIGHLDADGIYTGQFTTLALCGFVRAQGDADSGVDRLWQKKKAIYVEEMNTFSKMVTILKLSICVRDTDRHNQVADPVAQCLTDIRITLKMLSLSIETLRLLEETLTPRFHPRCPTICLTSLVNSDVLGGCSDRGGAKSGQIEGGSGALVSPYRLEVQFCKKGVCGDVRSLSRHVRCSLSPPVQGNSGVPLWRHTKARAEDGIVYGSVGERKGGASSLFKQSCDIGVKASGSGLIVNEAMASTRFSSYETAVLKLSDTWRG
ncbi:hypothetical protein Bca101_038019 [Brassica carinata]